jgi:hypothetical protein
MVAWMTVFTMQRRTLYLQTVVQMAVVCSQHLQMSRGKRRMRARHRVVLQGPSELNSESSLGSGNAGVLMQRVWSLSRVANSIRRMSICQRRVEMGKRMWMRRVRHLVKSTCAGAQRATAGGG